MQTVFRHTIFWLVIYFMWTYMKSTSTSFSTYLLINLVNVALYMIAYYTLKHIQIPQLYNKGKIVQFVISILISSFLLYLIWRLFGLWWIDKAKGYEDVHFYMSTVGYLTQAVQFYSPAMVLLAWESHNDRRKEQERNQYLEKEKLQNELKFLKAQLNPHFLFNTLNNLYSFVVNGSPKAPDMILRLSGILDYVLFKSQQDSVPLQEELDAIENFLELEKIRYGDRLEVNYTPSGDMTSKVSPLLLLSIVENAFKHGASGDIESPKINIEIIASQQFIKCDVWNTKSAHVGELNDAYKTGIGLSNIKRQLNLVYPKDHTLLIDEQETSYRISLKINHIL